MRRTALIAVLLLAACSSGGSAATGSGSSASSSGTSTTIDPAVLSSADADGARAFLTLYAAQLQKLDPTITPAQADCIPDTVLTVIAPQELFSLVDSGLESLPPDVVTQLRGALHTCGLTDAQIAKADLG